MVPWRHETTASVARHPHQTDIRIRPHRRTRRQAWPCRWVCATSFGTPSCATRMKISRDIVPPPRARVNRSSWSPGLRSQSCGKIITSASAEYVGERHLNQDQARNLSARLPRPFPRYSNWGCGPRATRILASDAFDQLGNAFGLQRQRS